MIDPMILTISIVNSCWAFSGAFTVCDLSERMSNSFVSVGGLVDQFNWYNFTDDTQRMLLIIFIDVHEPVVFNCFGSVTCSRESFKKVSDLDEKDLDPTTMVSL